MFNSIKDVPLKDFETHAPETIRELCIQSERHASHAKELRSEAKFWKMMAGIGFLALVFTLVMVVIKF